MLAVAVAVAITGQLRSVLGEMVVHQLVDKAIQQPLLAGMELLILVAVVVALVTEVQTMEPEEMEALE
jgi:hypothetical protein